MSPLVQRPPLAAALLAAALPCNLAGNGAEAAACSNMVQVRIYDYADVPPHILGQAKSHAARVFERVGIRVVWLSDPLDIESSDRQTSTRARIDHARRFRELSIRIYAESWSRRLGTGKGVFGYALQPETDTSFGRIAMVFDERARALAKTGVASRSVTLGHIIAHEIGHLLLGNNSHSRYGIMHVPWNRAMLKRAATGSLNFTAEEARRMRESLAERTKLAALRAAGITD